MSERVYPPSWRGRYPHMREVDMPLWNAFLDRYGSGWTGFMYDVRVGRPSEAARDLDAEAQRVWKDLSRHRIDAVGLGGEVVWIFEVKPYAGVGTIGQLVAYRGAYMVERPGAGVVRLGCVTDRFTPAVGDAFFRAGIEVWLV